MAIAISSALHDELIALAAADPAHEICGLLFGSPGRVEAIQPCANVSVSPANSFEIDPAALIAAHKAERIGGRRVIGCYHSHPNGLTTLSAIDRTFHIDYQLWLVIARSTITAWQPDSVRLVISD